MHGFSPGSSGFTADGDTAWLAGAPEPNTVPANQGDCPAGSPAFPAAGFLAAYDVASGAAKWVRALAPDARPRAVKRLSSGALAVLGRGGCYIPPPLKLGSTVDPTRFVSVISADGAELAWSRAYAVSTAFEHDQLEPTPDGGLLVTGTTLDDVVGDIAIAAPGVGSDEHSFIAKLDPKGNVVWTILVHATHPAYLVLFGMSAASDGVVHLLGQWNGPDELVFVSDLTLSGKGTFYAQIDGATGHGLAIRKLSDVEEKPLARIVTASGGGVYVSGPVDPASCPAIAPSMIPSNLVRLDAAGECVWRGAQMPGLNAPPLIPGAVLQALIGAGESPAPVVGMPGGWVATVDPVTGVIAQGTKVDVSGSDVVVAARLVVGFSGGVAGAD